MKIINRSFLTDLRGGLRRALSSNVFWLGAIALVATFIISPHAFAQAIDVFSSSSAKTQGIDQGMTDTVRIIYKVLDFVALILGLLGIWRILQEDYKWAIIFFITCAAAYFMPSIVAMAKSVGKKANDVQSSIDSAPSANYGFYASTASVSELIDRA